MRHDGMHYQLGVLLILHSVEIKLWYIKDQKEKQNNV